MDDMLVHAGFTNLAAKISVSAFSHLPLETLIAHHPDVLVITGDGDDSPSLANKLLQHPALHSSFAAFERVVIPNQAWACGTHHLAKAMHSLRRALANVSSVATPGLSR